jgi:hypothetical protein
MPRDPLPIHTAGGWLRRARSNLARAKQDKPDEVLFEDLCFDAQQAVEKALKALSSAGKSRFASSTTSANSWKPSPARASTYRTS